MKIKDIISDIIVRSHLFEMAFDKAGLEKKFSNACYGTAEHLVKILAFDDPSEYRGWAKEIDAFLKPAMVGRWNGNKTLKSNRIKELLWTPYLGQGVEGVSLIVQSLINVDNYKIPRTSRTDADIYKKLEIIYNALAEDGSNGTFRGIKHYLAIIGVTW